MFVRQFVGFCERAPRGFGRGVFGDGKMRRFFSLRGVSLCDCVVAFLDKRVVLRGLRGGVGFVLDVGLLLYGSVFGFFLDGFVLGKVLRFGSVGFGLCFGFFAFCLFCVFGGLLGFGFLCRINMRTVTLVSGSDATPIFSAEGIFPMYMPFGWAGKPPILGWW